MELQEIARGLRRWTARHPEWKEDVGCLWYETADGIVLVDPLLASEDDREGLDREIRRAGRPVHVLITVYWHARSGGEITERYGGRLWAHRRARAPIHRRTGAVTDVFLPGDPLPGGVVACTARGSEIVLWIPEHRALVAGDVILAAENGGLRLCPESWHPHGGGHPQVRENLFPLLQLPIDRVLVSHGEPVLTGGCAALEHALRQAPRAA